MSSGLLPPKTDALPELVHSENGTIALLNAFFLLSYRDLIKLVFFYQNLQLQ